MELIALSLIISAAACFMVAHSKGHNPFLWLILGLFFPALALLAIILIPAKPTAETHVQCPACMEHVLKGATVCKHCGHKIS